MGQLKPHHITTRMGCLPVPQLQK